ncbi:Interferon Regulatory Factor [Fasciola gigantica]|uniref:Interferon Regulatory Factor n=1 Tax=Fasciola gigantica TaxID=46835 RepID=A0A504YFR3_FASGI|nr:Interferon Regulatory Factor [Fasciola gigantica]
MEIRVRLRPWLESRLNEGSIEGLSWIDREKGIFKIPWKHHSKHTWTEADAAIFKDWAVVTGRYRAGIDNPDWPMWKTRLRCALNKAPDIQEVRQRHNLRCEEPFKVYRFISKTESLWRANATRNASMIFDGLHSLPKTGLSSVIDGSPQRAEYGLIPTATGKRTALIVQRVPGINTATRASVFVQRKSDGVFTQLPVVPTNVLTDDQGYDVNLDRLIGDTCQRLPSFTTAGLATDQYPVNFSPRHGCGQSLASPATIIRRINATPMGITPRILSWSHPPQPAFSYLPEIMEPEYHQLGVRIQHLNLRVKDAIVTNPNGCCIYFGRYDEINSPASPDPIEAQIPHHISETNKQYVDLLLQNMVRGVMLYVEQGSIFAVRMCKCAVFVYLPTSSGDFVLLKKLGRRERDKIFDYAEFMNDLRAHRLNQHPKPHFEVILAFGQQMRPNFSTDSLLVWCRVASCRAWFQLFRDHPLQQSNNEEIYSDDPPRETETSGGNSHNGRLLYSFVSRSDHLGHNDLESRQPLSSVCSGMLSTGSLAKVGGCLDRDTNTSE